MSLVIAFIGAKAAVMAGDMREIAFSGDDLSVERLESELYRGFISRDEDLVKRASELEVVIRIRDDKSKVSERCGALIGEVSSDEGEVVRKRRLYAAPGTYAIVEFENAIATLTGMGKGSNFVVFGNDIAKEMANRCIRENWKNGTLQDAVRILMLSMEIASRVTASVSKKYLLIQTMQNVDLPALVEQDIGTQ
jgi:hypothetical protein